MFENKSKYKILKKIFEFFIFSQLILFIIYQENINNDNNHYYVH